MKYAPREKRKLNMKIIIPILIVAMVLVSFGVSQMIQNKEEVNKFAICDFTHEETKEQFEKKHKNTYTINDYFFYGESLNLYHDAYNVETSDDLAGKSVILKDVCSDKEYSFVIRNAIDTQMILNNITEGYYEVYIVEDLIEKRAVFTSNVNDNITTIKRNGTRLKVGPFADVEYLKQREMDVDAEHNYLYIIAEKTKASDDLYDIAIDPGAYDYDFTYTVNEGSEGNGLKEYQETYKAATLLKQRLEDAGLKTIIVRGENEDVNSYGENGRLHRAYNAQAKYYIKLSFYESDNDYDGMEINYSGHSNGVFSKQITYYLSRNSAVKLSSIYNTSDPGNVVSTLIKGIDNRIVYDSDLVIREAGGKATQAGMYSENAQAGTAFFAKDNVYGMNAIRINLGYLTNKNDVAYWQNHREEYIDALAGGIVSYLNLEQE